MDADGGEVDGQTAGRQDAAFQRFDELWDVGVAGVEGGEGVCDADDGTGY